MSEELKKYIQDFHFDRLGAFVYSPEENTHAYNMMPLEEELAQKRYQELLEIQQQISLQNNEKLRGKIQENS